MISFTDEQQLAIDKDNTNIIVSAGAGSGKTAVLTARVIRKLKQGISINKLLVLTFTNEAAKEMKDRIRKAIKEDSSLKKELDLLDSSYITTFDSFTLSVLKKYHYALNMPKNISIVDSTIVNLKRKQFVEDIFNNLYEKEDVDFLKLIKDFTIKNDEEIKKSILKINKVLDLRIDKKEYLDSYIDYFYSDNSIDELIRDYENKLLDLKNEIKDIYDSVITIEKDKVATKYIEVLSPLINSSSYEEIKNNLNVELPKIVEDKEAKEKIRYIIDELKKMTIYNDISEIKYLYKDSMSYVKAIINIIKELDIRIDNYKRVNNSYEFIDISKMAIEIVKDNPNIRDEIKYFYNEIMVDEYQDTNDLQEIFVSLISNNNVYMVGDIKQSIYRFRNANPMIFKNKYEAYEKNGNGFKIDLTKNFRSRKEVLNNINTIFDKIMDSFLGGADYKKSHRMVFDNEVYLKQNDESISNNVDFYNYEINDKRYSNDEIEAFIIADDINKKIKEGFSVLDKKTNKLRNAKYSDFCIIMDRGTTFDLYKKVFEYKNIPLAIYKDEELTTSYDTLIFKNIIKFIIKTKRKEYDKEFSYLFTSLARSYLFSYSDDEIFTILTNHNVYDTDIYKKANKIALELDNLTINEFIDLVLKEYSFYQNIVKTNGIETIVIRTLYIKKMCKSLESLGYTVYDLDNYLEDMINSTEEIKYKVKPNDEGVKIMNIHKSKGLEFPICYYSGLYKPFNIEDMKDRFLYDKKYGIITPYYKDGIGNLPNKILAKEEYIKEEISERIRLFYVALTRAKEKIIFVAPLDDSIYNEDNFVSDNKRLKYKSFLNIINDVKDDFEGAIKNIDYNAFITKDYMLSKTIDISKIDKGSVLPIKNIEIHYNELIDNTFSKSVSKLITKDEKYVMDKGTMIHSEFENDDFSNPKTDYVKRLLKNDLFKNIKDAKIYKEYEFIYEKNNNKYHGIIDLILVYKDHIDIIDYKLSNIDDPNYKKQLLGYKDYIESKSDLKVNTYLYSIENNEINRVND